MADRRTTTGRGRGSKGREPESQETERQELELGEEIREPEPERTGDVVIFVDVMYINGDPVLHMVDEATKFQAARWLRNLSAKHTWDMLRLCWIDTYIGPPDCITHDAGTNFVSKEFRQYAATLAIRTKSVPIEAHWSIGMVERAHPVLRRAFNIIAEELKGEEISKESILQMAVKAVNDTAGPDGLVPTLLVFGAYPRMIETDPPAPSMIQRATAIKRAMTEIMKIRAVRQVSDAINQRNGPSVTAIHDTPLNSPVLVWLEGNTGQSGRWTGPFRLIGIEGENCKVQLPNSVADFRTTVVKPYHEKPEHSEDLGDPSDQPDEEQQESEPATPEKAEQTEEPRQNLGRSRQLPPRFREPDVAVLLNSNEKSIPNSLTKMPYVESLRKEINGLLDKGAFEVTNSSEIPKGIRIFGSRFVDEIINPGTDQAYEKSRLVVQAYNDKGKELILTESPTIQRVSQRIILAVAAISKDNKETPLSLYLRDISQAYVQSRTPLNRDFFVRPPSELEVPDGTILKIVRPLYGVPEAGNHWFQTYHRHHLERLKMRQLTYDPCILYTNENGFAIVGLQTDDTQPSSWDYLLYCM